jgi:D-amino peptidase
MKTKTKPSTKPSTKLNTKLRGKPKTKLYISADIEGIAGVVSRDQGGPGAFEYAKGREWMTGEVAAACEAAFEHGVSEVVVSDSHGNGQNLLLDDLPDHVRVVRSWPRPLGMMQGIEEGGFIGACLIGYHAGASNESGILAHTLYGLVVREIRINGNVFPEAAISAGIAAHFGVPVIMISGDDVFVRESSELFRDVEAVVTKNSYGTLSGITLKPARARDLIRAKVSAALARADEFSARPLSAPLRLQIDFKHRLPADLLSYLGIVQRLSAYTIEFVAKDMLEISRFLAFVTSYEPTRI